MESNNNFDILSTQWMLQLDWFGLDAVISDSSCELHVA